MQEAAGANQEMLGQAGGLDQFRHVSASSATRMQAAVWPGSNAASGGIPVLHAGMA